MDEAPSIAISGAAALECVRALAAGLSPEARVGLLAASLPEEVRKQAFKELLYEVALITDEEAGALVKWTGAGFSRRATQENCPSVKLGHKQQPLYRVRDVDAMLQGLRVWPKGRPALTTIPFPLQTPGEPTNRQHAG
ncbi:MAG TPA: hypothetical protein VF614_18310 [Chthoniobacteraceae bacterium]|jgi:hypothetical protein